MLNKKVLLSVILIIFLAGGAFAGFSYKNNSILKKYSEGEQIKGNVNISFDDEPVNGLFTSNFPGNITLIGLLEKNNLTEGEDYDCSISGCQTAYSVGNAINELGLDGEDIVGFLISGTNVNDISSASIRIRSDKGESCFSQVVVDILGDGENRITNTAYTDTKCGVRNYGCFNNTGSKVEATVTTNPYCEKVLLPSAPAFSTGAKIKNSSTVSGNLKMEIYSDGWVFLGSCLLPKHTQEIEELECVIEYSSSEAQDYFLCVKTENQVSRYKIDTESSNACGCSGQGCFPGTTDFEVFAQPLQFAGVDFIINDSTFAKATNIQLKDYLYDYILDKHLGECQNGCAIPIKFYGGEQTLTFSEVLVEYFADNILKSSDKVYPVELEEPTLSSETLNINLGEAGFIIPDGTNERSFSLFLGGEQIFSENINISRSFAFDVNPKFVSIGIETSFEATGFTGNLTNSTWDFGDGTKITSGNNKASHRYTEEGNFDIIVTLNKNRSVSGTRTFSVSVGNAKEAANTTILDYKKRITDIKNTVKNYPLWLSKIIDKELDLNSSESRLKELEEDYNAAESDDNYTDVMLGLIDLKIPSSINSSRSGTLPLIIGFENIDISYIEEISSEQADDESAKKAIAGWMTENVDGKIDYAEISGFYDSGPETIVNQFTVDVTPKTDQQSYLIFGYSMSGLFFASPYNEKEIEGGAYIPLSDGRKRIEFAIANEIKPEELGLYVSPLLSELDYVSEDIREAEDGGFSWKKLIIGLIILFVIAFVAYIALQEWYKRNYESSLFKSAEELYNLVNFIYNARQNGLNDGQIRLKLKQSKWTGEQISYATRKLEGKRTGMFEIPIFRSLERKKVKEEIEKRQENPGRNIY